MASIKVEREREERPPATAVHITLTPDEAHLLADLVGHLTVNKIKDVLYHPDQRIAEATYVITGGLYEQLFAEGIGSDAS